MAVAYLHGAEDEGDDYDALLAQPVSKRGQNETKISMSRNIEALISLRLGHD